MVVHSRGGVFVQDDVDPQPTQKTTHTQKLGIQTVTSHKYKQQLCLSVNACDTSVNQITAADELTVPACPHPPGLLPSAQPSAVAKVSVYALPGGERERERSRATVIQYCQTWRRTYNPTGFLVSLLPGVMGLLGTDASSLSSN